MKVNRSTPGLAVLVVDDNAFNRRGLCGYLQEQGYHTWEAGDSATAWEIAVAHLPRLAIIDIVIPAMPDRHPIMEENLGAHLAVRLKQSYPALGIILFSAYEDRGSPVFQLIQEGTRGLAYKLKGCPPAALLATMGEVLAGRVIIDPEVTNTRSLAADLLARLSAEERPWVEGAAVRLRELTPREYQVAQLVAAAHTMRSIANALKLEPKTVENYLTRAYYRLGLAQMRQQAPHLRPNTILTKACLLADLQRK